MKTNEEYAHLLHTDKPKEVKRSGGIRGVSASYMLIDEHWSLSPEDCQVILTRVSDNTVVMVGNALNTRAEQI